MNADTAVIHFDDFTLDAAKRQLSKNGEEIGLQRKVFDTLHYLLCHADRVVTKQELLDEVWPSTVVTDNALTRVISALRKVLHDSPQESRLIRALPRVGYRFVGTVSFDTFEQKEDENRISLAVLPFQPMSPSESDESLQLGMADNLISQLSCLPDLIVRPLATVRELASAIKDPLIIAERLNVDVVLDSSINRRGDRVRVSTRLLSTRDGSALWAATLDDQFSDIFLLQDTICAKILSELTPQLQTPQTRPRPTTPEAYRAYLEGRLFLGRFTERDVNRALSLFETALDEDPTHAPALASIAECHDFLGTMGSEPGTHFREAGRMSRRALKLDPRIAEATCVQAKIAWQFDWDWPRAEALFNTALRRFPNRADLHAANSDFSCYMQMHERAIEQARRALVIDPISPWVNTLLAQALHMSGRDDDAVSQARRALEFAPDFAFAHFFLGLSLFSSGDLEQGLAELKIAVASGRPDFVAAFGFCLGAAGRTEAAEAILEQVVAAGDHGPPIARAIVNLGIGNIDDARKEFEACVQIHDWHILLLHAEPVIAELAAGTGLDELLEPLGLPAA